MSPSDKASKLRRRERDWKPRLKDGGRRAGEEATGSALAAQMAMANIKDLNRRRDRGHDVDQAVLEKISQSLDTAPADTPTQQRRQGASQTPAKKKSFAPLVVGGVTAACALLAVVVLLVFGSSRYSVAGTMLSGNRPLAGVELQFHATNGQMLPARVTTSAEGTFSVSGLAAGVYRVTVQPEDSADAQVPRVYKQLESTPLRLKVDRNRTNETLYALQPKRR